MKQTLTIEHANYAINSSDGGESCIRGHILDLLKELTELTYVGSILSIKVDIDINVKDKELFKEISQKYNMNISKENVTKENEVNISEEDKKDKVDYSKFDSDIMYRSYMSRMLDRELLKYLDQFDESSRRNEVNYACRFGIDPRSNKIHAFTKNYSYRSLYDKDVINLFSFVAIGYYQCYGERLLISGNNDNEIADRIKALNDLYKKLELPFEFIKCKPISENGIPYYEIDYKGKERI